MNYQIPPLRRAILAAGGVIATASATVGFAAPANAVGSFSRPGLI
ncbi:MAG: hypothetical protein WBP81_10790 [Solirubrobacteraceae bacterium]